MSTYICALWSVNANQTDKNRKRKGQEFDVSQSFFRIIASCKEVINHFNIQYNDNTYDS